MPELPEVETIKTGLSNRILGKKIARVEVRLKKIVKSSLGQFVDILEGNSFTAIERRGKLLIFRLAKGDYALLIHLKLTGQLIYLKGREIIAGGHNLPADIKKKPFQYTHLIFIFSDQSKLLFNDMRQFGYLKLAGRDELEKIIKSYGVEPLSKDFTLIKLEAILKSRKTTLKAVLLNQALVAGIGNIYADEICFAAGLRPDKPANSLKAQEIKKLHHSIKQILKKAVQYRGTTFSDYLDPEGNKGGFTKFLKVYQREGERCLRCKQGIIEKTKIAGRTTRYCPVCQK